jgi:hypothetical protein
MSLKLELCIAVALLSFEPPTDAHDIYSPLKDRWGNSCCNDQDCRPADYRFTAAGVQMFVDGRWIDVPSGAIQYIALPGDTGETRGGQWCGGSVYERNLSTPDDLYVTKCAILPSQSASAQDKP